MKTFNSYAEMANKMHSTVMAATLQDVTIASKLISFNEEQKSLMDKIIIARVDNDFETWFKDSIALNELDLNLWHVPGMSELKDPALKVLRDRDMMLVFWNALNEYE